MSDTRRATLNFRDDDPSNPIMSIVIAHSSLHNGEYENPDTRALEPFSLFRWTKNHPGDFKTLDDGYLSAYDAVLINKHQHDVWAVAFQRKHNRYVEYVQQKEGFWKKLEEDVVKEICNTAIDVADLFDDETTTPVLTDATDKAIHAIFTHGDGDVIIENWVHWDSYKISFKVGNNSAHIHSDGHNTSCKTERFGNQSEKKQGQSRPAGELPRT